MVVIGEIIEVSSLLKYSAQQTSDYGGVGFGSFLKIKLQDNLFVIVTVSDFEVRNPSLRSYPRPKKLQQEEVASLFPDLFDQFPTIISLEVLGYIENNKVIQEVPPLPPKIYASLETMSDSEIYDFHKNQTGSGAQMEYLLRLKNDSMIKSNDSLVRKLVVQVADLFTLDTEKLLQQL